MPVQIRTASPADADTIHRFIVELATYEQLEHEVKLTPSALREQLSSDRPAFDCLIAEGPDGAAIGFALFYFGYSTWTGTSLFLEDLYVTPTARGSGAGLALMRALAEACTTRGCARFEWHVLDWNESAIAFYKSLGAYPMEGWTRYRLTGEPLRLLAARSQRPIALQAAS